MNLKKNSNASSKVIIITGATAVGKTALTIELAKSLNTEIISADSMQIYRGLEIGAATPSREEQAGISHHLLSFIPATASYSVAEYSLAAKKAIDKIHGEGKIPIVTGGTGLYLHSLLYQMDFAQIKANKEVRTEIETILNQEGKMALYAKLKSLDSKAAERIHPNNTRKISRALEIALQKGEISDFNNEPVRETKYDFHFYVLDRKRDELYNRINKRVDLMFEKGLIEEVEALVKQGLTEQHQSMQGIGYKETLSYLNNKLEYNDLLNTIKQNSRRYAKRQLTWFRRYDFAKWIRINTNTNSKNVVKYIIEDVT